MVASLEANVAAFLSVAVLGVSLIMLAVSALSWRRLGHPRLLWVAAAFGVLAAKGALGAWHAAQGVGPGLAEAALDFGVVMLLYLSVAQR